jgi:hypothetical protein
MNTGQSARHPTAASTPPNPRFNQLPVDQLQHHMPDWREALEHREAEERGDQADQSRLVEALYATFPEATSPATIK